MKAYILERYYPLNLKSCINGPLRKLRFCKWATPNIQEIIKQVDSSRQLLETVNLAFMKNFDFLVKIALFWAFLLFLGDLCHKLRPKIELDHMITALDFRP